MALSLVNRIRFGLLAALAVAALPASAQFVNGQFEDGNFTGWTTSGNAQITTAALGTGPTGGTYQALLATATDGTKNVPAGVGVSASTLETMLGVTPGSLNALGNGTPVLCSGIMQQLNVTQGQRVTIQYNFLTNQGYNDGTSLSIAPDPNFKDFAFISLVRVGGNSQVQKLADTFTSGQSMTAASNPFLSQTGFLTKTFVISISGTYKIGVGVVHASSVAQSNGVNSALLVDDVTIGATTLTISAPATVVGGDSFTGTVNIGVADTQPETIALSSNTSFMTPPPSVTLNVGEVSKDFTVTTQAVLSAQTRILFATRDGVTVTTAVRLIPIPRPASLTLNPTTVTEGGTSQATVLLSSEAAPGGSTVTITDNSTAITVPPSVVVGAGNLDATFTVSTSSVSASTTRQVTVTLNGQSRTANITINPVFTFSLSKTTFSGNDSATGTVTLGSAAVGDQVVAIADNSANVSGPPSVTITSGTTTGTFTINTTPVSTTATRTVSATYNGVTKIITITLNP